MENLRNSGLNLRTINPVEYNQLIEDLRYNFTQLLNLPGFKGMPGQSITGDTGVGVRGSKWIFVTLDDVQSEYPSITSVEQITLQWVNSSFNDDPTKFSNTLYIPGDNVLLIGDILILPSGQLIMLAEVDVNSIIVIKFIDTGITFAQVTSLTEQRVIDIVNQMINGSGGSSSTGAFKHYNAVAKNGADTSPALNVALNQDSVVDIVVSGSGPGAALPEHTFVAATEQAVGTITKMCYIAGSAKRYHELIQTTQTIHTNNYAPGVDDFASGVFLQTSYNNGIIFGSAESESIRQFGRLYRSVDSTVLTSSYSPFENEYSELRLYDDQALLRALKATVNVTTMDVLAQTYTSKMFSYAGNVAKIGDYTGASIEMYGSDGIYLKNITSANILSTNNLGRIVNVYSIINTLSGTLNTSQIVDALTIQTALNSLNTSINDLSTRVLALETADTTKYFQKLNWPTSSINFNTLTGHGNYIAKSGSSVSNYIPYITSLISDIIINVFVSNIDNNNTRILQEVTEPGPTTSTGTVLMNGLKWFRIGYRSGSAPWTWSYWSKILTGIDKVDADGALRATGSFNEGTMKITHVGAVNTLVDTSNTGDTAIRNITFDPYGHVTSVESIAIGQSNVKAVTSTFTSWQRDRRYVGTIPLSGTFTIISCNVDLECLSGDGGYSVGEITQAPLGFEPNDSGGHNFDQGMGVIFRSNSTSYYLCTPDRVYVRRCSGSTSTQNDTFEITSPSRWRVRVTFFYI